MSEEKKYPLGDFFSFRTMISLSIVKVIYAIGFIIITAIGIVVMVAGFSEFKGLMAIFAGMMIVLVGNLVWRILCEWWVVFFSIHEQVVKIEENTQTERKHQESNNLDISHVSHNTDV